MKISEMHILFRSIAQASGMQTVRGILSEQIDVFINTTISNRVNQIISSKIGDNFSDTISDKLNPFKPINEISALYKMETIQSYTGEGNNSSPLLFGVDNTNKYMIIGFNVNTNKSSYRCRHVYNVIGDMLQDYCNAPSITQPLITSTGKEHGFDLKLYIGKSNKLKITSIDCYYIKKPNIVKLGEDESDSINCDLSDNLHDEIVYNASNLFLASIGATSQNINK